MSERKSITVAGDARDTVGQFRGPNAKGELLIIDDAVYACPECGTASDWTTPQHRPGCTMPEYRTRLFLRPPTDAEIAAAADRAADGMATAAFDLPAAIAGPLGYVEIPCAECGTLTREYGITDPAKGWALCPDCLAKPGARAKVDAKLREIRAGAAAAQQAAAVEEGRDGAAANTGPVTIRILGLASGEYVTPFDGQWLVEYDPTRPGVAPAGRPMTAHIVTTANRDEATVYPDGVAAWQEWRRESGLPYPRNAPLTEFSISITAVGVPDDPEHIRREVPWGGVSSTAPGDGQAAHG